MIDTKVHMKKIETITSVIRLLVERN